MSANESFQGEVIAERRRFPRFPLKLKVTYKMQDNPEIACHSENISLGGVAMRSDHMLEIGQSITLALQLPYLVSRKQDQRNAGEKTTQVLEAEARVAWSTRFGSRFIFGVEFVNISDAGKKMLEKFLEEYEMDQPHLSF